MIEYAALRDKDGTVYTGYRHHLIFRQMPKGHFLNCEQGFVTDTGEFVDRKQALTIAQENNQIIEKHGDPNSLYSEDIFAFEYDLKSLSRDDLKTLKLGDRVNLTIMGESVTATVIKEYGPSAWAEIERREREKEEDIKKNTIILEALGGEEQ